MLRCMTLIKWTTKQDTFKNKLSWHWQLWINIGKVHQETIVKLVACHHKVTLSMHTPARIGITQHPTMTTKIKVLSREKHNGFPCQWQSNCCPCQTTIRYHSSSRIDTVIHYFPNSHKSRPWARYIGRAHRCKLTNRHKNNCHIVNEKILMTVGKVTPLNSFSLEV